MHDWLTIFRMARTCRSKKKPYNVEELKFPDFLDFEQLSKCLIKNKQTNTSGEKLEASFNLPDEDLNNQLSDEATDNPVLCELQPVRKDLAVSSTGIENITEPATSGTKVNTDIRQENVDYTEKGTIRKKKKYNTPLKERVLNKFLLLAQKHCVKVGCDNACAQKCTTKISEDRRHINAEYWKMVDAIARKCFMIHHVFKVPIKQRTVQHSEHFRRNHVIPLLFKR
nr:unnamed protein product [Callosobruchus chinensis]